MIKAIIFDLGGVVISHSFEHTTNLMAKNFDVKSEDVVNLYERMRKDWNLGKITVWDVAKEFNKLLPEAKPLKEIVNSWKKEHEKDSTINKEVLKILNSLRKKYKIVLLSNTIDLHYNAIKKTGIYSRFDKLFASYKLGLMKPQPKIFKKVLSQIKVKPQEAVFVDDNEGHIKGAKNAGLKTVLFENAKDLAINLKSLGVEM